MQDYFKAKGQIKASRPDSGGGAIRSEPVLAIVKDNVDPTRSGRLQVYLSDFGSEDPDDSSTWVTVSFMTPFYGLTEASAPKTGFGSYLQNPSSYGMWFSPPDIGSTVICIFINGDPNYGYWIGCAPQPEALHMVPAVGASSNVTLNEGEASSYGGSPVLPVTNMNTNNSSLADSDAFLSAAKPVHSYAASIFNQQGLLRDPIRGPISTSAQRESPSRVGWGVSSPGRPIYEGGYDDSTVADSLESANPASLKVVSRRGGHSIILDDGDIVGKDQLIRIRTAMGHQITMSDDGQCLNIMHSNGQSWIELGKEGTIDMYSTNSVNIRTQGDLNLHADNNININAMKDLNIAADNINVSSTTDTKFRIGGTFNNYTMGSYTVKVNESMSIASSGDSAIIASGAAYINGSQVNLNSGDASLVPEEVPPMTTIAHTDTLFDASVGFAPAPGKLMSIVSRAPAHAPWANWGQGVDVKVELSSEGSLPSDPSETVAAVNNAAPSTPDSPVTVATASTAPNVGAVSSALDSNTTAAMVAATARDAATGPAAAAVAQGAGVVDAVGGPVAAIGSMAMSPAQLESAGVIKPGSAPLVENLVKSGSTVQAALPSNLFTGANGAKDLTSFINNPVAQASAQVTNMQKSQAALTQSGVITGKEAPGQIAGLVSAGATAGITATINFAKTVGTNLAGGAMNAISGAGNAVSKAISSGNFAANLSSNITGGLGSLGAALSTAGDSLLKSAKGIVGGAFAAVTKAFKPFQSGVPQDLTAIAAKNAAGTNGGGVLDAAKGALGSLTGAASKLASSINLNLSGIPGGLNSISSVVNNAPGSTSSIPGLSAITAVANNAFSAVTNGVSGTISSLGKSVAGLASGLPGGAGLANSITGAANKIAGDVSGALGSLKNTSLTSLASSGLSVDAAAQLSASISSLGSGGAAPVKLPTVAENTTDRSSIAGQLSKVLGNSKIPLPNFTGMLRVKSASLQKAEKDALLDQQRSSAASEFSAASLEAASANNAYQTALNTLPQGDPEIANLKNAVDEAEKTLAAANAKLDELLNQQSA
jgi:hypothetical protein